MWPFTCYEVLYLVLKYNHFRLRTQKQLTSAEQQQIMFEHRKQSSILRAAEMKGDLSSP